MSKWRRFKKVKMFANIISDIARIISYIYWLFTDIYEFKTGRRPNFDKDWAPRALSFRFKHRIWWELKGSDFLYFRRLFLWITEDTKK